MWRHLNHVDVSSEEKRDFPPAPRRTNGAYPAVLDRASCYDWEPVKEERRNCHYCQLEAFPAFDRAPVAFVNCIDDTALPKDFTFISESVFRQDVERADAAFRSGCECRNAKDCMRSSCSCLKDMYNGETPVMGEYECAYQVTGPNKDCIRDEVLQSRDAIYECHRECSCNMSCPNRVVERGRTIPLEIFRTRNRGWGVRSEQAIKKGQFVDRYVGEIITASEATSRRNDSDLKQSKDVYLFALDKFTDPNSEDERLRGPSYEIDGEFMSGATRFINHSCEPNLRIFAVVGDLTDKNVHQLAFFALRDIKPDEELTFDYVDGVDEDNIEFEIQEQRGDMVPCLCGSKNCRGFLW